MTTIFRIEMFIVATAFFIFVVRSINQNKLTLKRSTSLLVLSLGLVIFSLFPKLPEALSNFFGFETTSNFLYFCAIIFLLAFSIFQSVLMSTQEEKIKNLIQEISIIKSEKEKENDR